MPDLGIGSMEPDIDADLLTLTEAARLTGRPLRLIQRWAQTGILPIAAQDEGGHKTRYIRLMDLRLVTRQRRKWGTKKGRAKATTTTSGKPITLTAQKGTDSRLEEGGAQST